MQEWQRGLPKFEAVLRKVMGEKGSNIAQEKREIEKKIQDQANEITRYLN